MLSENTSLPKNLKACCVNPNGESEEVTLSSLCETQPLILFFYPKDMTPGCTTEAQRFRDTHEEIKSLGAKIVGCSKDIVNSHIKFINKHKLPYSLISDTEGKILDTFGVWGEKKMYGKTFLGIQRSTFILQGGKIIKVFPKVSVKSHAEEIISFLKTLS